MAVRTASSSSAASDRQRRTSAQIARVAVRFGRVRVRAAAPCGTNSTSACSVRRRLQHRVARGALVKNTGVATETGTHLANELIQGIGNARNRRL